MPPQSTLYAADSIRTLVILHQPSYPSFQGNHPCERYKRDWGR